MKRMKKAQLNFLIIILLTIVIKVFLLGTKPKKNNHLGVQFLLTFQDRWMDFNNDQTKLRL